MTTSTETTYEVRNAIGRVVYTTSEADLVWRFLASDYGQSLGPLLPVEVTRTTIERVRRLRPLTRRIEPVHSHASFGG